MIDLENYNTPSKLINNCIINSNLDTPLVAIDPNAIRPNKRLQKELEDISEVEEVVSDHLSFESGLNQRETLSTKRLKQNNNKTEQKLSANINERNLSNIDASGSKDHFSSPFSNTFMIAPMSSSSSSSSATSSSLSTNWSNSLKKKPVVINNREIPARTKNFVQKYVSRDPGTSTICYILPPDVSERLQKGNLNKILSSDFRTNVTGQIRDHILYVHPNSQKELEKIFTDQNHPYAKLQAKVIDNKDIYCIIHTVKYREVINCVGIQNQLRHIGVESWEPLSKDKWDERGIKCKCRSKADLIAILKEFYLNGLRLRIDGVILTVGVNPDVNNPLQCYHCFEYGKHVAEDCKNLTPVCEKCGEKGHYVETCEKTNFCCLHCKGEHDARDHSCPVFVELKLAKMNLKYTKITGEVALKTAPKFGQRMDYKAMVTKHIEAQNISKDWNSFREKSIARISHVESEMREVSDRYTSTLEQKKNDFGEMLRMIKDSNDEIKKQSSCVAEQSSCVAETMKTVATTAAKIIKEELTKDIVRIEEKVNNIDNQLVTTKNITDYNAKCSNERISKIENWIGHLVKNNGKYEQFTPIQGDLKLVANQLNHNMLLDASNEISMS